MFTAMVCGTVMAYHADHFRYSLHNFSLPADIWPLLRVTMNGDQYSPQSYISARYFGLIRNFRRYSLVADVSVWCFSGGVRHRFLAGRDHKLDRLYEHTLYAPYATSLRMVIWATRTTRNPILMVCHNIDSYIKTLSKAISA